jgi:RNA polymerase sigma factor (sigma-70 family)
MAAFTREPGECGDAFELDFRVLPLFCHRVREAFRFRPNGLSASPRSLAGKPTLPPSGEASAMNHVVPACIGDLPNSIDTLRGKAASSICSCERLVLDALNEIASLSRRDYVKANHAADILFSNATAERLEAFLVAANDLVAVLGNEPGRRPTPKINTARAVADKVLEARIAELTERQKQVFRLVLQGLQNKTIAFDLNISETTVKAHVGAVLQKLKVYNRARAIALYSNIEWDETVSPLD